MNYFDTLNGNGEIIKGYVCFDGCIKKEYKGLGIYTRQTSDEKDFTLFTNINEAIDHSMYDPDETIVAEAVAADAVTLHASGQYQSERILVIREVPKEEVFSSCNKGNNCNGIKNAGDSNTGTSNVGFKNAGVANCGYENRGFQNIGEGCDGDSNIGFNNKGRKNIGNNNRGVCCVGDWNKGLETMGCFMTESNNIMMFNKPSTWTLDTWATSVAKKLLDEMQKAMYEDLGTRGYTKWMSINEVAKSRSYSDLANDVTVTKGLLISDGYDESLSEMVIKYRNGWWRNLSVEDKSTIKSMPNFDADIFYDITGINVKQDQDVFNDIYQK